MLEMGEFSNFIFGLLDLYVEEEQDKKLWDLFVHSYTDQTFDEFKKERLKPKVEAPSEADLQATLDHSRQLLNRFNLSNKGGE